MRALVWVFRILVFLFLFAFALRNTDLVNVRFFFGANVDTPMIVVILASFGVGVFIGVLAMVGPLFRTRRQVSKLRKAKGHEVDAQPERIHVDA